MPMPAHPYAIIFSILNYVLNIGTTQPRNIKQYIFSKLQTSCYKYKNEKITVVKNI